MVMKSKSRLALLSVHALGKETLDMRYRAFLIFKRISHTLSHGMSGRYYQFQSLHPDRHQRNRVYKVIHRNCTSLKQVIP